MECQNNYTELKAENIKNEMNRMNVITLGISEMRWPGVKEKIFRKTQNYLFR